MLNNIAQYNAVRFSRLLGFYQELGINPAHLSEVQRVIIQVHVLQFGDEQTAKDFIEDWSAEYGMLRYSNR